MCSQSWIYFLSFTWKPSGFSLFIFIKNSPFNVYCSTQIPHLYTTVNWKAIYEIYFQEVIYLHLHTYYTFTHMFDSLALEIGFMWDSKVNRSKTMDINWLWFEIFMENCRSYSKKMPQMQMPQMPDVPRCRCSDAQMSQDSLLQWCLQ